MLCEHSRSGGFQQIEKQNAAFAVRILPLEFQQRTDICVFPVDCIDTVKLKALIQLANPVIHSFLCPFIKGGI